MSCRLNSPRSTENELQPERKAEQPMDTPNSSVESTSSEFGFEWCCRPILIIANCFGIPLRLRENYTKCKWVVHVSGWLFYCLNIAVCLTAVAIKGEDSLGVSASYSLPKRNYSTAWQWNMNVSTYNGIGSIMACHTVLLAITATRWKDLAGALCRMEKWNQFDDDDFKKFRYIFIIGTGLFFLGSMGILWLSLTAYTLDLVMWKAVLYSCQRWMISYMNLSAILLNCFGWLAFSMLKALGRDIDESPPQRSSHLSSSSMQNVVCRWNRHYFLIVDYVHQFNRCFGSVVLFLVAPFFVRIINTSFQLMMEVKNGRWTMDTTVCLTIFLLNFGGFTTIVSIPHNIREEAFGLTRKLRKLQFADAELQDQVNVLMVEISNLLPQVTAAGFFDVDLHLVPTLVGTTLTYLIILFQFQTSET